MDLNIIQNLLKAHNTVKADRGPHHQFLRELVGRWRVVGHNADIDDRVDGIETFYFFKGDYFLVNEWDRPSTEGQFSGTGWIAYHAEDSLYRSYSISDGGYFRVYNVEVEDRKIKYIGPSERGSLTLNKDASFFSVYWEQKTSSDWKMICSLEGHRMSVQ